MSNANFKRLQDFSLGLVSVLDTMSELAINSEEALFLLMAQAGLPMPQLPEAQTKEMVEHLRRLGA